MSRAEQFQPLPNELAERWMRFTKHDRVYFPMLVVKEDAICEGWVVKRGRSTVFCEAEMIGAASGKLIARSVLTYNVSVVRT
jgi:acyl-coenzyme A thioesterase PaaI-like protein